MWLIRRLFVCIIVYTYVTYIGRSPHKGRCRGHGLRLLLANFFPFPGVKISGQLVRGESSRGDRVVVRPPSKFRFLPRPRSVRTSRLRCAVRGAKARTWSLARGAVRRGMVHGHGGGGYTSGGKKVRRARRSSKNMVHPVGAAQWPWRRGTRLAREAVRQSILPARAAWRGVSCPPATATSNV